MTRVKIVAGQEVGGGRGPNRRAAEDAAAHHAAGRAGPGPQRVSLRNDRSARPPAPTFYGRPRAGASVDAEEGPSLVQAPRGGTRAGTRRTGPATTTTTTGGPFSAAAAAAAAAATPSRVSTYLVYPETPRATVRKARSSLRTARKSCSSLVSTWLEVGSGAKQPAALNGSDETLVTPAVGLSESTGPLLRQRLARAHQQPPGTPGGLGGANYPASWVDPRLSSRAAGGAGPATVTRARASLNPALDDLDAVEEGTSGPNPSGPLGRGSKRKAAAAAGPGDGPSEMLPPSTGPAPQLLSGAEVAPKKRYRGAAWEASVHAAVPAAAAAQLAAAAAAPDASLMDTAPSTAAVAGAAGEGAGTAATPTAAAPSKEPAGDFTFPCCIPGPSAALLGPSALAESLGEVVGIWGEQAEITAPRRYNTRRSSAAHEQLLQQEEAAGPSGATAAAAAAAAATTAAAAGPGEQAVPAGGADSLMLEASCIGGGIYLQPQHPEQVGCPGSGSVPGVPSVPLG